MESSAELGEILAANNPQKHFHIRFNACFHLFGVQNSRVDEKEEESHCKVHQIKIQTRAFHICILKHLTNKRAKMLLCLVWWCFEDC